MTQNKMKKNHIINGILLAAMVVSGLSFVACSDEPDKYEVASGVPTIKYIRCTSSEVVGNADTEETVYTNGQLVTEATPQSVLCIVGENLRSITGIRFNNLDAVLNNSYMTDNTILVAIPKNVPTEVTDKIYFSTKDGQVVTYDFHVVIPKPVVNTMNNEYASVGTTETLTGNYFIDDPNKPLTVAFTKADGSLVNAEITEIAADFTYVKFIIPEGAAEGPITVTSVYGATKSMFHYKDTRGMLFDFDTPNEVTNTVLGNHGWNGHNATTDETAISGNFFQFGDGEAQQKADNSTWDEGNFSFVYWPGDDWSGLENYASNPRLLDVTDFSNYANMALKFEMNIPSSNPWKAASMQICFAGVEKVTGGGAGTDIYGKTVPGANNSYMTSNSTPRALYRPWTITGSYDTGGEWITVTLPITSSFIYAWDGSLCQNQITAESFASLWMFVASGGIEGTDCQPIIKIDNIRVVSVK